MLDAAQAVLARLARNDVRYERRLRAAGRVDLHDRDTLGPIDRAGRRGGIAEEAHERVGRCAPWISGAEGEAIRRRMRIELGDRRWRGLGWMVSQHETRLGLVRGLELEIGDGSVAGE